MRRENVLGQVIFFLIKLIMITIVNFSSIIEDISSFVLNDSSNTFETQEIQKISYLLKTSKKNDIFRFSTMPNNKIEIKKSPYYNIYNSIIHNHDLGITCFFFNIKRSRGLNIFSYVFFCLTINVPILLIYFFFSFSGLLKKEKIFFIFGFDSDDSEVINSIILEVINFSIILFCFSIICNLALSGYKYSASGRLDFFFNIFLYILITYISPIFGSVFFLCIINQEDAEEYEKYLIYLGVIILVFCLMGLKIIDLIKIFKQRKEIKEINSLLKYYIKNSINYKFIPVNLPYVYTMIVLCLISFFMAICIFINFIFLLSKFFHRRKQNILTKKSLRLTSNPPPTG